MRHPFLKTLAGATAAAPTDPNFKNVTLLLHGDGTNGGQNNTFLDSGPNNLTITRGEVWGGTPTQGTFSPYGDRWSNYFDGTGDYLTAPANAAHNFGTGDFTIECWFYRQEAKGQLYHDNIFGNRATVFPGTVWHVFCGPASGDPFYFQLSVGGTGWVLSGGACRNGEWNHIAVVRSGNTFTLYINGSSVGSGTQTAAVGSSTNGISVGAFTDGAYPCIGYVSNLRIVKGTAVYTSNFTPSTTPLTAITNTSLLTCQSNRFRDVSANNFTITRNGDVSVQRFSPFSPTAAYAAETIGGSGYFQGANANKLSVSSETVNINTSPFTVESWVYYQGGTTGIRTWYNPGAPTPFQINVGILRVVYNATSYLNGGPIPSNTWTHIAVTRDSSNVLRSFTNGVLTGSVTTADAFNYTTPIIGERAGNGAPFVGYIAGFRLLIGTALYTSTFTPPTSPPTAIANTRWLVNFTNAAIIDNAMMCDLETVGNAQIDTSVKKPEFGTGSLEFDGNGDYLAIANSVNLNLTQGDFTIELWVYPRSFSASNRTLLSKDGVYASSYAQYAIAFNSAGKINGTVGSGNGTSYIQTITSTTTFSLNTWYHVAFVRSGTTLALYVNGTSEASATQTGTMVNGNKALIIGWEQGQPLTHYTDGFIDDLRITKGVARYTAAFTPPTAALPDL